MRKEATNMDEQKEIPFRYAHGLLKVDCASKSWNDIQVRYFEKYPGPGKAYADMSSERSTLVVCLEQRGGHCEARLDLKVPTERKRYDAGFAVTVWGYSEKARLVRDVRLVFDPNRLPEILGDDVDGKRLQTPIPITYDDRVTQCAHLLADACIEPVESDRLYGESLTTALLAAYWTNPDRHSKKRRTGGLSSWQLRQTLGYLEANFAADVSLAKLAALTGLSQSQFSRAFHASAGVAPYQWTLQARVRKAQELLAKADQPISAVAIEVGFADQSHFTKVFRRQVGVTPKKWQRDRKIIEVPDEGPTVDRVRSAGL